MKYYIIAGEASGDLHASNLMRSLLKLDNEAEFRFFGGDLMKSVGGTLVKHYSELAYMGFIPVLLHLPTILKNLEYCKKDIGSYKPDVVILIDYAGFNLKIAKYIKQNLNIPVHYYISPKVWAWKKNRIKLFRKYVDEMLCILPFEVEFFKNNNYDVHYVGNPTVDAIAERSHQNETFEQFISANNLENKPIIAILAGSRKQEIKGNLPLMLKSLKGLSNDYQIVIAGAPGIEQTYYGQYIDSLPVSVLFDQTYRILSQSECALVTSGTATLETALLDVPQAVCYRTPVPNISYWGFKYILHTPFISLVNLICGRQVVRELFAKYFTVDNLRDELQRMLHVHDYKSVMLHNYKKMRKKLGPPGASDRAAEIIYSKINNGHSVQTQ